MSTSDMRLSELLERQYAGDDSAAATIGARFRQLVEDDAIGAPEPPPGVYVQWALLSEWRAMFAYRPGRREALPLLITLAQRVEQNPDLDSMELYATPEWAKLVGYRGPAESVLLSECAACGSKYPRIGTNGFVDLEGLVCTSCGDVTFVQGYGGPSSIACTCGGLAKADCPTCDSSDAPTLREISPYEYFASHRFRRPTGLRGGLDEQDKG